MGPLLSSVGMRESADKFSGFLCLCALGCCLLSCGKTPVNPQPERSGGLTLLFRQDGGSANNQFGFSAAGAGDVNGDTIPDLIVGAPGANNVGSAFVYTPGIDSGRIKLFLLYPKSGTAAGDQFGFSVAGAGDINGDTTADFIIGAPQTSSAVSGGLAFVYSGKTGGLLYQPTGNAPGDQFGHSVAGAGDLDGDGKADFVIGAPGENTVYVYSGAAGGLLYQKMGGMAGDSLGYSVAGVGDLNRDGRADFAAGAPGGGRGSAFIYSGMDGSLLYQLNGALSDSGFGFSVGAAGDVNGDTIPDFAVGAPFSSSAGLNQVGSVYVYSGSTGTLLYKKNGTAKKDRLGWSVAGAGDFNGDKRAEVIVGAPSDSAGGSAFIYSGTTGNLLSWVLGTKGYRLGYSVAGAGDIYNNVKADAVIGVPFVAHFIRDSTGKVVDTLFDAGSVYVFSAP